MASVFAAPSRVRGCKPLMILLAGVACGNLPLLVEHFRNLWKQPQYQFFPLVLLAIAWLVRSRAKWREVPVESRWGRFGIVALVGSVVIGIGGTLLSSPWLATLSFVAAVGGVLLLLQTWLELQNGLGIWALLCLILKPPLGLDTKLAFWLQGATAKIAGAMLDLIGVQCIVDGNTIQLPGKHLFVEEACSGVVSLMSIIAACLIIAVYRNRPILHTILLTASAVVWAGILNTIRIVIIGVAFNEWSIDLLTGWKHEALGLTLFACTAGLCMCTDSLLEFLFSPIWRRDSRKYGEQETAPIVMVRWWNAVVDPGTVFHRTAVPIQTEAAASRLASPILAALGVTLILAGATQLGVAAMGHDKLETSRPHDAALALDATSMPALWYSMAQTDFESSHRTRRAAFGEHSRSWNYSMPSGATRVSLDFMFHEFHELTECYVGIGWRVSDRRVRERSNGDKYVEAELVKESGERAILLFGSFDHGGNNFAPPDASLFAGLTNRIAKQQTNGVYQTQLLVQAGDPSARESLRQQFLEFSDRMVSAVTGASK